MNLKDIKQKLIAKQSLDNLIIFKYSDTDFIVKQYLHTYADYKQLNIVSIDNLSDVRNSYLINDTIYFYKVDKLKQMPIKTNSTIIICCKSIDTKIEANLIDHIVEVPKIEKWQIKDMIRYSCPNIDESFENLLLKLNDMYAIENELSKVSIFDSPMDEVDTKAASASSMQAPKNIFKMLYTSGALDYLKSTTIFDLITALFTKDISKIVQISSDNFKIEPVLFYSLLNTTLHDIIRITVDPRTTNVTLGISAGKFWAVKNTYSGYWSKAQLEYLLAKFDSIDKLVKTGKLSYDNMLVSYLINEITQLY